MAIDFSPLRNPLLKRFFSTHFANTARQFDLGTPVVADPDRIVTTVDMKVGAYTIAAQPDVPRNITVTSTAVGTADTMGTITAVGTDADDQPLTEVLTPISGSLVVGAKAFKTVASVTGAGWVIDAVEGTKDTIIVGVGALLGMPVVLEAASQVRIGLVGVAPIVPAVAAGGTLAGSTVDLSSGTYNGTKRVLVTLVE